MTQPKHLPSVSILIPVYRYRCEDLLRALRSQAEALNLDYEIILGNDCSGDPFDGIYRDYAEKGLCKLFEAPQNMGAGLLRNRLSQEAEKEQLLILDSDTLPADTHFLERYLEAAQADALVCGGFIYPELQSNPLRYKYGTKVESKSAKLRNLNPHQGFISMAFMIDRALMLQHGFPPAMGMGYEDLLFGEALGKAGVGILHIDNPVWHYHNDTPEQFLATTRRYIDNLATHEERFEGLVKVLNTYNRLKRLGLAPLLSVAWKFLSSAIEKNLTGSTPHLKLFSVYKLLYLANRLS